MTDEEISELAECLEDACREAIATGRIVSRSRFFEAHDNLCPLHAAAEFGGGRSPGVLRGLPQPYYGSFVRGFDNRPAGAFTDPRLYALGQQFAERYP